MEARLIKENLERGLTTMRENRENRNGLAARHDLELFIGSTPEIVPLIHKLLDAGRIPPPTLRLLYNDFMLAPVLTDPKERIFVPPKFYNEEIEERFHLHRDFIELIQEEGGGSYENGMVRLNPNKAVVSYKPEDYFHIERLCNELLVLLSEPALNEVALPDLAFDIHKSRLYVKGTEVPIRKFSDQYHTLRILFENQKDLQQEWFFSDIAERVDAKKPGDKRYYNAVYQIRQKLTQKGFPDFFITTRQSLKISPKYLS